MSNPTSNFGWQMPTPTDLVTDLPADFEVFGQAVDTDFVDLLGGTTGQVLSKTSATDLDFTWINNDTGDITGVTAGTGISGGGTSGTVTVTNSMATAFTTSGDLIQATGSGTFARLGTGTNGQYLTTNGTTNSWGSISSGGMTVISTGTLSGTGLTFSSIPGTYYNLQLSISGFNAGGANLKIRVNGDTGSNYVSGSARARDGAGGVNAAAASPGTATAATFDGEATPDNSATNTQIIYFPEYAAATGSKAITGASHTSSTFKIPSINFTSYVGTAGAITSITILTGGTFSAGTYTLYGVK